MNKLLSTPFLGYLHPAGAQNETLISNTAAIISIASRFLFRAWLGRILFVCSWSNLLTCVFDHIPWGRSMWHQSHTRRSTGGLLPQNLYFSRDVSGVDWKNLKWYTDLVWKSEFIIKSSKKGYKDEISKNIFKYFGSKIFWNQTKIWKLRSLF